MKYDDASWHYDGDFPEGLPPSAGATHIGMFVAWAMLNGLAGDIHITDFPDSIPPLAKQQIAPGEWLIAACDEKFTDEDLSEEGNRFALHYYAGEEGLFSAEDTYSSDYDMAFSYMPTLYHVPDTWESYAVIAPIIARRFAQWRQATLS